MSEKVFCQKRRKNLIRRLLSKCTGTFCSDTCWKWQGYLFWDGYGRISVDSRAYRVHRLSYQLFVGPVPRGKMILHSCDEPTCVNPSHLRPGTALDNARDALQRGHTTKGIRHAKAKLSEDAVRAVRKSLSLGARGQDLARQFSVSPACISNIKTGKRWAHVQ